MGELKSKFFLRSRKIQAALILGLQALSALGASAGIDLPIWLTTDWLTGLLDAVTGDSGLGAALLDAYAAAILVGSHLRPDGAALNLMPLAGTLPLAPSLRAGAVVFFALALPGLALDASAAPAYAYVHAASAVGRWAWTPADNATAYNVYTSRNGGAFGLAAAVTVPNVTLPFVLGEGVEIVVEPLAPGSGIAAGPLSDASLAVRFVATADADGDGIVGVADFGAARVAFGRCIIRSARGVAALATDC